MARGTVLFAVVVVLLVGGVIGRPTHQEDPALTLTGEVHIVTAPDGKTTAVTIDGGDQTFFQDGVVDHAFRVQHLGVQYLEYDGSATVQYVKNQLTIRPHDRVGWVFAVASPTVAPAPEPASKGYSSFTVIGLSHHWGKAIHRSPEEVTAGLLSSSCSMTGGDPSCDDCEAGGPGAQGCNVDCDGGSGCSARCSSDSMACCSCVNGCRCCPPREEEPAHVAAK
jgi:hypothetical protein